MAKEHLAKRMMGCVFGLALGDALGRPFEQAQSRSNVEELAKHPEASLEELAKIIPDIASNTQLQTTDDTEMMIGLLETLIEDPNLIDQSFLYTRFVLNFTGCGYAGRPFEAAGPPGTPGAQRVESWEQRLARMRKFKTTGMGSNIAAMRVAPLGLCVPRSFESRQEELHWLRVASDRQTEVSEHTTQSKEGSFLLAYSVWLLSKVPDPKNQFNGLAFLKGLRTICLEINKTNDRDRWIFTKKIDIAIRLVQGAALAVQQAAAAAAAAPPNSPQAHKAAAMMARAQSVSQFARNLGQPDPIGILASVAASGSVPAAICIFARFGHDPINGFAHIVECCVKLGGDTDTTAAMALSLFGTLWGVDALPRSYMERLACRDKLLRLTQQIVAVLVEGKKTKSVVGTWVSSVAPMQK